MSLFNCLLDDVEHSPPPPQLLVSRVGTENAGTPVSESNAEMQGDSNKKSY